MLVSFSTSNSVREHFTMNKYDSVGIVLAKQQNTKIIITNITRKKL